MTPDIKDIALLISIVFNLILFWRTSGRVSPELVVKLFELAKDVTARTPSPNDDKLVEELRGMFNALLNAQPPEPVKTVVETAPNANTSVTTITSIPNTTTISYSAPQDFDSPVIP